jgi:hypothetical protein
MIRVGSVAIVQTEDHGAIFSCEDVETHDALEDFLTESCGKSFSVSFRENSSKTYFEPHESVASLQQILDEFSFSQR